MFYVSLKSLIRNKLVLRNQFVNLHHKDKEHLALRNNFMVTKKFLITKFDCSSKCMLCISNIHLWPFYLPVLVSNVRTHNMVINPNWHEGWYFYPLVIFGSNFVSWFFIKTFQTFLMWKLTSMGLSWHPAQLIESFKSCF